MKTKEILDKRHTVLNTVDGYYEHQGLFDYTQMILTMKEIIFELGLRYYDAIKRLRQLEYHSKEQNELKQKFPIWFVGGTFPYQKTEDKDILEYSNILAIDIDKKDNDHIDMAEIREKLFELPYVFGVLKSISGEGYYVLILIEDGRYTKEYYHYIQRLWKKKYDINIDTQCTNIGRKRFISYEDNIRLWIKDDNEEIKTWKLRYIEEDKKIENKQSLISYKPKKITDRSFCQKAIWRLLDDGYSIDDIKTSDSTKYGVWYHIACDFHHFEDGLDMFIKFSQNSSRYHDDLKTITRKYNNGRIETDYDDISRKWCGICKNKYGNEWWKQIKLKF